jgi:glycyl-tRNA synthetase (class II)
VMIKKITLLKLLKYRLIYYSKMDNDNSVNIGIKFYCECCDVKCRDNYDYKKHLQSKKHKRIMLDNQNIGNNLDKKFICECGKSYNFMSGLCKHKKSCKFILDKKAEQDKTDLLIQKIQQIILTLTYF